MHTLGYLVQRVRFQRQTHAPLAPQEIRYRRNRGAFGMLEQERRPRCLHHAVSDLGDLENRINLSRNALQFILLLQLVNKIPKVSKTHFPAMPSSYASLLNPRCRCQAANSSTLPRLRREYGTGRGAACACGERGAILQFVRDEREEFR